MYRNGGWRKGGGVEKIKEIFKPTCISGRKTFQIPQKRGCFLMLKGASHQGHSPSSTRKPFGKIPMDLNEGQRSRPRNNPRVKCNSRSLTALRYNNIYIYIYMYIYICYVQKTLRYQAPFNHIPPPYKCNCSSTLGTVLGFTCSIIGKA